jgi:hydrogen peroxide-dependent heme synthase
MSAPATPSSAVAHPPETVEGWYVLHQIFHLDRAMLREWDGDGASDLRVGALAALREVAGPVDAGWSAVVPLIGSSADVMLVHFRPTLDAIGEAQRRLAIEPLFDFLDPVYSFLSVTEAGLYHLTAELAREALARGGSVGDAEYRKAMDERSAAERESAHVRRRLYPELPPDMPYVCFYPMSKRRAVGQNWYALTLDERSRLMHAHGLTGRRYAGRVTQVISGAIGFDAWEWGVTLFAKEPLEFKRIVTEMRFDEVSAQYGEFGDFYVGRATSPAEWLETLF